MWDISQKKLLTWLTEVVGFEVMKEYRITQAITRIHKALRRVVSLREKAVLTFKEDPKIIGKALDREVEFETLVVEELHNALESGRRAK